MNSRRKFLWQSATVMGGSALIPNMLQNEKQTAFKHVGVQLYSVRADMAKDPKSTIEAVGKMGYKEVEGYNYADGKWFGYTPKEFSTLLKDNGLKMPSTHHMFKIGDFDTATKQLSDKSKEAIDTFASMGANYVVCPWMEQNERDKIEQLIPVYQAAASYAKKAGIRFAYHNHDFEFKIKGPDGRLVQEWILHELDPAEVAMEMDIYWVYFANHNPLDWFRLYPGRWELCHVKDMAKTEKRETVEVGDGSIDFKGIFKKSAQAGFKHYVVELEHYVTTPLEGIKKARLGLLNSGS